MRYTDEEPDRRMTDWHSVPAFGEQQSPERVIIRPSAYGLITDADARLAIVHTPSGVYLPGGGSNESEEAEQTVIRETLEECGLVVHLGLWRRAAIERVFAAAEHTHFEKRCTFCDGHAIGPFDGQAETDHVLEWVSAVDAATRVAPASHRWAILEWLAKSTFTIRRANLLL